jgi:molecular chaperone HtpG
MIHQDNQSFQPVEVAGQLRRATVDLPGVMSVLSKHLYSTPVVALRELVQNAHDSIVRRRIEESNSDWQESARIDVISDPVQKTIRIIDTGAGLTENEIHTYLATVGSGYTRTLRESGHEDSGLIGMFGLGFLSAFVLAKRVRVRTTSFQTPDLGFQYMSSNAQQYSVMQIPARNVGTEVLLELQDNYQAIASGPRLRDILELYCTLLRAKIYLTQNAVALNPEPPPWRAQDAIELHPVQARKRNLEFAKRFEHNFAPICCIPVNTSDESDARGLLWIQDGGSYSTSDNRNLSVFLRGMLLDDDARDLLPSWAGFAGGVIESDRLTPTASREDLQRDEYYYVIRQSLAETLITGLANIAKEQPEAWRRILFRHNDALLGAALCDSRLFNLLLDSVTINSLQGRLPARELVSRGAVHVLLSEDYGFESMLCRAMGTAVAFGNYYGVLPFLRRWTEVKGFRLVELGTEQGNRQLFRLDDLPDADISWLKSNLTDDEKLVIARYQPDELPLVVVPDREAQLKRRLDQDENDRRISTAALHLARQFTANIDDEYITRLYLNLNNSAVQALLKAVHENNPRAEHAVRLLRSFKTIVVRQDGKDSTEGTKLQQALVDFAQVVQLLIDGS